MSSAVLLRLPDVERRVGLKRTAIYTREALGLFPQRLKLGPRFVAWSSTEIDQWIAAQLASRAVSAA